MSTEPVTPSTPAVHHKHHEMVAAAFAAAKLKQAANPAISAPATRATRAAAKLKAHAKANPMLTPHANGNAKAVPAPHVAPVLPIVGFTEGTMISCKVGDTEQSVAVQDLRKGLLVKTSKGFHAVGIVGSRGVTIPESADRSADRLYTLSKDKFPTLTQDLTISGRRGILVDKTTDAEKKCTIDVMGHLSVIDTKFCLPVCAHADAALSSTVGAATLYNFSLDTRDPRMVHGVYANGLLVDHSPSYHMMSSEYTRRQ
jgi:hypothetical protein